ncbi:transcription elongation factor GreA [Kangiella japonica]|uniref:Transcription elongation factor GreA n=1 Tax=Kangiella japonica TaxID=647384 RepID=A0ABN0SYH1_9GAMM
MSRVPMTAAGAEQLQEELNDLKKVQRPKVVAAIAEAREHGDLKENAEYHAAREQQGFIEGRIQEIEAKLSNAQIVDISKITNTGKVIFGSTVVLINLEDGNETEVRYQIVGDDEADIKQNKISINSPIARGLIGKEEGDIADIQTPGGKVEYEVGEVLYI